MNQKSLYSERMRVFAAIAVDPSDALLGIVDRLDRFGRGLRATRPDQLHVTLKFFGEIDDSVMPDLTHGLDQIATRFAAFDWSMGGVGAFPSPRRPSVIWAGIRDDGRLAAIADEIESLGEKLGFPRERRAFHPHVTLARVRDRPPRELPRLFEEFADEELGRQRAVQIVLFRSLLKPQGAVYEPVHVAPFRGPSGRASDRM